MLISKALSILLALLIYENSLADANGRCDLIFSNSPTRESIKIGQNNLGSVFLGKRHDHLFFTTSEGRHSVFALRVNFQESAQYESLPDLFAQTGFTCSPMALLACLKRLDQIGRLPDQLKSRIDFEPESLLKEMIDRFYSDAIRQKPQGTRRDHQHRELVNFLKENVISVRQTKSFSELERHLARGLPAYIGAYVKFHERNVVQYNGHFQSTIASFGTKPSMLGLPMTVGSHAVAAMGLADSHSLLGGRQLIVLDPHDNMLNLWAEYPLRFASPRFLLLE